MTIIKQKQDSLIEIQLKIDLDWSGSILFRRMEFNFFKKRQECIENRLISLETLVSIYISIESGNDKKVYLKTDVDNRQIYYNCRRNL